MKKGILAVLLILSLILFAISGGLTLAYFVVEDETINELSVAKLSAVITEEYIQGQTVFPGDTVSKVVNITNTGAVEAIIRVKVVSSWGERGADGILNVDPALSASNILIDYNSTHWIYCPEDGYFYYRGVLAPGTVKLEPLFESYTVESETDSLYAGKDADIRIELDALQSGYGSPELWGKSYAYLGMTDDYIPARLPTSPAEAIFVNQNVGFIFRGTKNDLLYSWNELVPGESRTQKLTVKNLADFETVIRLRAEYLNDETDPIEHELIDDLLKEYVFINIIDKDGKTIYSGPVWGNLDSNYGSTMKYPITLGSFSTKEAKEFTVTVGISTEVDNKYSLLTGKIKWIFSADGSGINPDIPPYESETGTDTDNPPYESESGTDTDNPYESETGTDTDNPYESETGTDTSAPGGSSSEGIYDPPQTGDSSNLLLLIILMIVSGGIAILTGTKLKRS